MFEQVLKRATDGLSKRFITKHGADKAAAATGRFLTETFSESTTAALEAHRDSQGFVNIPPCEFGPVDISRDRKSTRLNSSHVAISYAVFCLKKKKDNGT